MKIPKFLHLIMLTVDQFLDQNINRLNLHWIKFQPWSWLQNHQDRIRWACASANRTIPPEVLDQHLDELAWCFASRYQPWSWLQGHQDRIRWHWASANRMIPPEVLDQHLDELNWYYASERQPWSWLQGHQDRVRWSGASANTTIPPEVLDQHLDELNWYWASEHQPWSWLQKYQGKYQPWSFLKKHKCRIIWDWASCNTTIPHDVLDKNINKLDWIAVSRCQSHVWLDKHRDKVIWYSAVQTQPWYWLQHHQRRINWRFASGNPTIPPEVFQQHLDELNWYDISQNNFAYQRAIDRIRRVRQHVKSFHLKNWWKMSRLVKTRQFCEWYYHPNNIGGQIAKRRIAVLFC